MRDTGLPLSLQGITVDVKYASEETTWLLHSKGACILLWGSDRHTGSGLAGQQSVVSGTEGNAGAARKRLLYVGRGA